MQNKILFKDIPRYVRKYITEGFRKAFRYSKLYKNCRDLAKVSNPKYNKDGNLSKRVDVSYKCAMCSGNFKSAQVQVDHVAPVVPPYTTMESMTLEEYYLGVFTDNLQVLCKPCHNKKTRVEKMIRTDLKKLKASNG